MCVCVFGLVCVCVCAPAAKTHSAMGPTADTRQAATLWDPMRTLYNTDMPDRLRLKGREGEWHEAIWRLDKDITLGELQACGEAMGRWKAPGEDGVPLECLVRLGDRLDGVVLDLLNDSRRQGDFPMDGAAALRG